MAVAVVARPVLWPAALRAMRRTSSAGWWRHPPFLPVPSGEYMAFRAVTQYGEKNARPEAADVVNYLEWLRQWDTALRQDRHRSGQRNG